MDSIKPSDLSENQRYVFKTEMTLSNEGLKYQSKKLIPPNTVCVVCIGTIGKICFTNTYSFTNQQINSIVVDHSKYDAKYIYYLMKSNAANLKLLNNGSASGRENVNKSSFEQMDIEVCELKIQQKIAGILSAYDDLIENNTRRIEILEEMARMLYREWFVKFRFPGHEAVQFVESELGLIPEGWEYLEIEELIRRKIIAKNQDGNHGEKHPKSSDYCSVGVPFIMAKDMVNNILNLDDCNLLSYEQAKSLRVGFAREGDVLLTHKATMGRVAIVPKIKNFMILTPQVTYYRVSNPNLVSNLFLYSTFLSDRFQDILAGQSEQSTRKFISITNQRRIKILYPSPEIIKFFSNKISAILEHKQCLYLKNINLRKTRDLLLPRLISGEIDVENLDINTGIQQ